MALHPKPTRFQNQPHPVHFAAAVGEAAVPAPVLALAVPVLVLVVDAKLLSAVMIEKFDG